MRAVGDGCRVYIAARASSRDVDELGVDVDDVVAAAVDVPIRGAGDVHDGDEDEDGGPGPGGVSHGAGDGDGDDTGDALAEKGDRAAAATPASVAKVFPVPKTTPAWRGATSR